MRVAERLEQRGASWRELDALVARVGSGARRPAAKDVMRLGELYRAACTDLMLAEQHDLPRETVTYLHSLVGPRPQPDLPARPASRFATGGVALFQTAPRRLRSDPALKLAALVFWGTFLLTALAAAGRPEFSRVVVGEALLEQIDDMYAHPVSDQPPTG